MLLLSLHPTASQQTLYSDGERTGDAHGGKAMVIAGDSNVELLVLLVVHHCVLGQSQVIVW